MQRLGYEPTAIPRDRVSVVMRIDLAMAPTHPWQRPHAAHRYGWAADIKSHSGCSLANPIYTRAEMQALRKRLEDKFSLLAHPLNENDHSCPHYHVWLR